MKRIVSLAVVITMALVLMLAGCTKAQDQQSASAPATTTSASTEKFLVGFANIAEEVDLQIAVRESMVRAANKLGDIELILTSNDYDGQKAVKNADDMITRGVDAFIEFNIDASVAPVIMEKMNAAKIPVFAIDIAHPGAAFFGANNVEAGKMGGEYIANKALEKWGGEPDCFLLLEDSTSGEVPLQRITCQPEGFKKVFPNFADEKIFIVDATTDAATAQKRAADFLQAHPDFTKIAIGSMNDVTTAAALAAIETAGRESQCIMCGQNESFYLSYLKDHPEAMENEVLVGAVAYFFDRYGDFLMPAVEAVLKGGKMPENVYVEHQVVTRDNAATLFPSYFN